MLERNLEKIDIVNDIPKAVLICRAGPPARQLAGLDQLILGQHIAVAFFVVESNH